jgi:hypothetical protein
LVTLSIADPEVKAEVFKNNKNTVRAGAHTDYGQHIPFYKFAQPHAGRIANTMQGSLTLLFQDMAGGLQVLSPNGNYINASE